MTVISYSDYGSNFLHFLVQKFLQFLNWVAEMLHTVIQNVKGCQMLPSGKAINQDQLSPHYFRMKKYQFLELKIFNQKHHQISIRWSFMFDITPPT